MREVIYPTPYRNVIIPIHEGQTGISYSGGADSVILMYLLLANGLVPDKIYTVFRNGLKNASISNTLGWLENQFNVELKSREHEFVLIDNKLRRDIYQTMETMDWLYTGVTQNPFDWDYTGPAPSRPLTAMDNKYRGYATPFVTFDKRATIYLYETLGLSELLELTRSCPKHDSIPACGQCFHCSERAWATRQVEHDLSFKT
jgi:7-cyano-7-deazaguanine synthase in queuosine biosynthesis